MAWEFDPPSQPSKEWSFDDEPDWSFDDQEPESSVLYDMYDWGTKPRHNFFGTQAKKISDFITDPSHASIKPTGKGGIQDIVAKLDAMRAGLAGGFTEGAGQLVDSMTNSPLGLAMTLASMGEMGAVRAGLPAVAKSLGYVGKLTGIPFAVHGAGEVLDPENTLGERAQGLVEFAGGGAAALHSPRTSGALADAYKTVRKEGVLSARELGGTRNVANYANIIKLNKFKNELATGNLSNVAAQAAKLPVPEGWTVEIGKTHPSEQGTPFEAEIRPEEKKIVFATKEDAANVGVHNHEVAHVMYEMMSPIAKKKLMDLYVMQKQNTPDWKKIGLDNINDKFKKESLGMDLGIYYTNPNELDPSVRKIFDLLLKKPTPPLAGPVVKGGAAYQVPIKNEPVVTPGENIPPEWKGMPEEWKGLTNNQLTQKILERMRGPDYGFNESRRNAIRAIRDMLFPDAEASLTDFRKHPKTLDLFQEMYPGSFNDVSAVRDFLALEAKRNATPIPEPVVETSTVETPIVPKTAAPTLENPIVESTPPPIPEIILGAESITISSPTPKLIKTYKDAGYTVSGGNPNGSVRMRLVGKTVVDRLKTAIKESIPKIEEQATMYTKERAKRFNKMRQIGKTAQGEEGARRQMGALKGPYEKVKVEPLKLEQSDVDLLFNEVRDYYQDQTKQAQAFSGLWKMLKDGEVPQLSELKTLRQVFGDEVVDLYSGYHGAIKGGIKGAKLEKPTLVQEMVSLPRALQSSWDISAPMRQGLGLIHTKEWWLSWNGMVKSFGSEAAYEGILKSIYDHPNFQAVRKPSGALGKSLAERAGIKITDLREISTREESMQSELAEKFPLVRRSNRAFTGFLDKVRADVFNSLIKDAERIGLNPRQNDVLLKQIGDYINNASGRGSLGGAERAAVALNQVFFSPRLIASRVQMLNKILNPYTYATTPKFIRWQYTKSLIGMVAAWETVGAIGKLVGGTVNDDLTNADFGKIKIGDARLDPGGGFLQYLVLMRRLATNKFTSSSTNESYEMGQKYGTNTGEDIIYKFLRNKMAPIPGMAMDFFGRSRQQPFQTGDQLIRMLMPMILQDFSEMAQTDPDLMWMLIPSATGMGLQEYRGRGQEPRFLPESIFPRESDFVFPANAVR
jgi:hypothetical protein